MQYNKLIKNIVKLCSLSYKEQKDINYIYKNRPYDEINNTLYNCINIPKLICSKCETDCQVYTTIYNFEGKNILVVIYRGTSSKKDILIDMDIYRDYLYLDNYIGAEIPLVHSGFFEQFNTVKCNITNIIDNYIQNSIDKSNLHIIFTGHSLGGALSTLSCLYFYYKYISYKINIDNITFGSPRVGDRIFVKLFNDCINKSYRFVNDNDPIPLLPSPIRYKHVKGCYWLYEDTILNEIKINRTFRFIRNLFLNFIGYKYNPLNDHKCISYIYDIDIIL